MAEGEFLKIRVFAAALALLAAACLPAAVAARPPAIIPGVADLTSSADRMISYRHQEHLWQTADGALHLVVNRGTQTPGAGLALFSSFDGGLTWSFQLGFDATDDQTTGDGQLQGDLLSVAYQTTGGAIVFSELRYDAARRIWVPIGQATAFYSVDDAAINPACGADAVGNVWCAFVAHDRITGNNRIRMVVRPSGATWLDSGLVFGPVDKLSVERSARPIRAGDGMGMVYTVRDSIYWAFRSDGLPVGTAWSVDAIYTSPSPQRRITDFYASHFSVVGDDGGNVHILFADDFDALYFRRETHGAWTSPFALNANGKASYSQIGLVNGNVTATYSMHRGDGQYMVSTDGGRTFKQAAALVQPSNSGSVKYGTPRVEMPTRTTGTNTVLQQFSDGPVQKLLVYSVPTTAP